MSWRWLAWGTEQEREIAALFLQQDLVGRGAGPASWAHVALERSFSESAVPQRLPASVATQKQQPRPAQGLWGPVAAVEKDQVWHRADGSDLSTDLADGAIVAVQN